MTPLRRCTVEMHLLAHGTNVEGADFGVLAHAIAGHRALHIGPDAANRRIVDAENCRGIERHAMQEIQERALELVEIVPIGFHVVGVDVGHHRHHRHQVQEGRVRFVASTTM
jgi:hypothetical protein